MQPDQSNLIMNVDDNDGARYVKTRILNRAGFTVIECENGADTLRLAREQSPSLILLDVKLPDMNGMEVCRILKSDPATQNILILQTSASFLGTADKIRALDVGADNYLMEPIDPDELLANVKALLRLGYVEKKLREIDRRKDEFIATLAHELRNPIGPIRNAVEIWSMLEPTPSLELLKAREIMRRQTNHLAHLVDDLLDVSRVSSGKINLRMENVPVKTFVESAIEIALPLIEKHQHKLDVSLPELEVLVSGDPLRLAQIVSNLLLNAAKFTPSGGSLKIECDVKDNNICIKVVDNGIGISSADISEIFGLFTQANRVPDQGVEGLGIGLALVKELVALHGGNVSVQSEGVNCGSSFEVVLPVTHSAKVDSSNQTVGVTVFVERRILVVDDNQDAAITLSNLFEISGHEVKMAFSGKNALEVAESFDPHFIFLDIGLPDMTGYDLALALRANAKHQHAVLIALTGFGQDRDKQAAMAAGFDHHFVKPLSLDQLNVLGLLSA
jgi:signal transduction histidine kinase